MIGEIVERVWPGSDARVEPLGGGITNRNFRVDVAGESFVLRIGGKDTELLGIDRSAEHEASVAAARTGVGTGRGLGEREQQEGDSNDRDGHER